jgi:hypothetical protein
VEWKVWIILTYDSLIQNTWIFTISCSTSVSLEKNYYII